MMMPSLFGRSFFEDLFDMPAIKEIGRNVAGNFMSTDVCEKDGGYEISMNLPGYKKEDVKGEIKDGYLIITANNSSEKEEKDENSKYIRRERYVGSCTRSFYVGKDITEEDIKAKFTDGVLKVLIPKQELKSKIEEKRYIAIEG